MDKFELLFLKTNYVLHLLRTEFLDPNTVILNPPIQVSNVDSDSLSLYLRNQNTQENKACMIMLCMYHSIPVTFELIGHFLSNLTEN